MSKKLENRRTPTLENVEFWLNLLNKHVRIINNIKYEGGDKYVDKYIEVEYGSRNWLSAFMTTDKEDRNEILVCFNRYHSGCFDPRVGGEPPSSEEVGMGTYRSPINAAEKIMLAIVQETFNEVVEDEMMNLVCRDSKEEESDAEIFNDK